MSQHTPGPWGVDGRDITTEIDTIATVHNSGTPIGDANARLIAAAPEMVAFIKNIVACSYHDTSHDSALLVDARALLAKVEGQ